MSTVPIQRGGGMPNIERHSIRPSTGAKVQNVFPFTEWTFADVNNAGADNSGVFDSLMQLDFALDVGDIKKIAYLKTAESIVLTDTQIAIASFPMNVIIHTQQLFADQSIGAAHRYSVKPITNFNGLTMATLNWGTKGTLTLGTGIFLGRLDFLGLVHGTVGGPPELEPIIDVQFDQYNANVPRDIGVCCVLNAGASSPVLGVAVEPSFVGQGNTIEGYNKGRITAKSVGPSLERVWKGAITVVDVGDLTKV